MTVEVCDSSELANLAAQRIASALIAAISRAGEASLALAGGTTPRAAYEELAKIESIEWPRIKVYFGDERAVPKTDPDSNFKMAKAALFDRVALPADNIHAVDTELPDRNAAAQAYATLLPARISVLVLGIGEDGHTASLFPGSPALEEQTRLFLPVIGPKPPPARLTITPPVIAAAETIIMLATGAGKADAVARALRGPLDPSRTPSTLARRGLWLLDRAAAQNLAD